MADRMLAPISVLALGLLAAVAGIAMRHTTEAWEAITFLIALVAVGHLVRVAAPSGRYMHLGMAAAIAAPLLLADLQAVVAVLALSLLVVWVAARIWRGAPTGPSSWLATQAASFAVFAGTFAVMVSSLEAITLRADYVEFAAVAGGALAWFVTSAALDALVGYERNRLAVRYLWLLGLSDWPVMLSLFSAGALAGFAWDAMSLWALPVALIPYGLSHAAFARAEHTRTTYRQTISALARIPEVAGLTEGGHAVRTAGLAIDIAKDMGLRPDEVADLEYAALMHDVGRITLSERAVLKAGYSDQDVASWGAEIVAQASSLSRVAEQVACQHQPYRRPGEARDESLPVAANIIRTASAYDQAVSEIGLRPLEAIEVLHGGAAYDFDPAVVGALRRVATRRGLIAH